MSTASTTPAPNPPNSAEYLIHTADLPPTALTHKTHPLLPTCERYEYPIGDATGFTKTGVRLYRLPPGAQCTPLHWHSGEDEWMYVLDAGEGGAVLIWEPSSKNDKEGVLKEVTVKNGDFLGFKAGVERAHTLRAGTTEMVYLVGGSRSDHDVCRYPLEGKKLTIDWPRGRQEPSWTLEDVEIGGSRE